MAKRLLKAGLLVFGIPIAALLAQIFVIRPIVALAITRSPDYVYRSYVWGASDIQDYEKFPYRDVQNAGPALTSRQRLPPRHSQRQMVLINC